MVSAARQSFAFRGAIAVASNGHLFVADTSNNRITKGVDSMTETPVLASPAKNGVTKHPVSVAFSLPETAANGKLTLTLTGPAMPAC